MPQMILPLIPKGATQINGLVNVWHDGDKWTYFYWTFPIYSHKANDTLRKAINDGGLKELDFSEAAGTRSFRIPNWPWVCSADGARKTFSII